MPTYLLTQDALNVEVSCFANYDTPANPVTINLLTWLTSQQHRAKVEALRLLETKDERDAVKATLPAITPSGIFTYRKESNMVAGSHTRLIQFDIDLKENRHIRNYADLKAQISKLSFVAYCALSASGKGYWGLVVIAYPERHGQHFDALRRVFAHYKINIDTKPRNVASLRGYSYDPAPYMPERVQVFDLYDTPPKPKLRTLDFTTDADEERKRVEVCIEKVSRQGTYIGDSYSEWYEVGCSLANAFGESGRDYFHHISQHYPGYQPAHTDRQFTACLKGNSRATLGTFFHLCQQVGVEWKELLPLPAPVRSNPVHPVSTASRPTAQQLRKPAAILKPEKPKVDHLMVERDEPIPPGAVPTISAQGFHEWQRKNKYWSKMGLPSLKTAL